MRTLRRKTLVWLATASAGSAFVLEGCDPQVRDTVLSGAEGAAQTLFATFVQAFFESLTPKEDEVGPSTVMIFGEEAFAAA